MTAVEHRSKAIASPRKEKVGQMCLVGEADSIYAYQVVQVVAADKGSVAVREVWCEVLAVPPCALKPLSGQYATEEAATFLLDRKTLHCGTQRLYPMSGQIIRL